MKNNFRKFLIYFISIFLGSILIYSMIRLSIDLIDFFVMERFNFNIPFNFLLGSFIGAFIVAILLLFDKSGN